MNFDGEFVPSDEYSTDCKDGCVGKADQEAKNATARYLVGPEGDKYVHIGDMYEAMRKLAVLQAVGSSHHGPDVPDGWEPSIQRINGEDFINTQDASILTFMAQVTGVNVGQKALAKNLMNKLAHNGSLILASVPDAVPGEWLDKTEGGQS